MVPCLYIVRDLTGGESRRLGLIRAVTHSSTERGTTSPGDFLLVASGRVPPTPQCSSRTI